MAITLGTNIPSYVTKVQLNRVSDNLSNVYKKLSTGKKINSASDDSAGLVISQNMQAKINGSKQATQNIQTAMSFLTIAEDGMGSISEHFQRINDLLTNMANDTNDVDSRTAEVREVIERLSEIDRLAKSTNFNGMCMLDGSVKNITVQMGAGTDRETNTLEISRALSDCQIKAFNAELPGVLNPDAVKNNYKVGEVDNTNDILHPLNLENGEYQVVKRVKTGEGAGTSYFLLKKDGDDWVYATPVDGKYVKYTEPTDPTITDSPTAAKTGYVVENTKTGKRTTVISDGANEPTYYVDGKDETYNVGTDMESAFEPTNENCRKYMKIIQEAIAQITTRRGMLGAYENRMESSQNSLTTTIESLETAKVPYTDTDIAEEAANLTKNQIMQQINVAVMANTNTSQQLALSLLS